MANKEEIDFGDDDDTLFQPASTSRPAPFFTTLAPVKRQRAPPKRVPEPEKPAAPPKPLTPPPQMTMISDEDELETIPVKDVKFDKPEPLTNTYSTRNKLRTLIHTHMDGDAEVTIHETIDVTIPRTNFIFKLEIVELAFFVAQIIIAYLVVNQDIVINNYIYLIVGSICALIILVLHIFNIILYTRAHPDASARHVVSISITAGIAAVTQILVWFLLGRWIIAYGFCCGTSENQPNPLDLANYTRFYLSYGTMFDTLMIAVLFNYGYSIVSHLYPESSAALPDHRKKK
jgi:hypothetical protein